MFRGPLTKESTGYISSRRPEFCSPKALLFLLHILLNLSYSYISSLLAFCCLPSWSVFYLLLVEFLCYSPMAKNFSCLPITTLPTLFPAHHTLLTLFPAHHHAANTVPCPPHNANTVPCLPITTVLTLIFTCPSQQCLSVPVPVHQLSAITVFLPAHQHSNTVSCPFKITY